MLWQIAVKCSPLAGLLQVLQTCQASHGEDECGTVSVLVAPELGISSALFIPDPSNETRPMRHPCLRKDTL